MCTVKEERIKNLSVRSRFYTCPTAQNLIAIRQLTYIGKVLCNRSTHTPYQLLTTWCNHPRKRADVLTNNKKIVIKHLILVVPDTNKAGSLKTWAFHALDQNHWSHLINSLRHPNIVSLEGPPHSPVEAENTPPASSIRPLPQPQVNPPTPNTQTPPSQKIWHLPREGIIAICPMWSEIKVTH